MQLMIYTSPFNRSVRMLLESLRTLEPAVSSEHITALPDLAQRLRKPMGLPSIGILMPTDSEALSSLVDQRHLLRDMRIILVLPNAEVSTWKTAHLLRPRYISYGDGDLSDVIAVTSRMVRSLGGSVDKIIRLPSAQTPNHPTFQ